MTETIDTGGAAPLIIPELAALDASPGSDKSDVITYLAGVVAGAGRADGPEGLAADALARESTAPTGIPGGIAIPHCRPSTCSPPASDSPASPSRWTSAPPTAVPPTSSS